jgi:hypothetical protein
MTEIPSKYVGSEIGDINRQIRAEIKHLLNGDENAAKRIEQLSIRKEKILRPRRLRCGRNYLKHL